MRIKDLAAEIESFAPLPLQESYDNAGLLIGDPEKEITKGLITLDITEEVFQEALDEKADIIIAHHPLIFKGLKSLTGKTQVERIVIRAIQHDIAIYAAHTNIDNVPEGVNNKIAGKLGLAGLKILKPAGDILRKLVVFCPTDAAGQVREAMFSAGAGHIGNYDSCSFNLAGKGSFRAGEGADPYVGEVNKLHFEEEVRIESIYPVYLEAQILREMINAHPYEEVAYDIYPLGNTYEGAGSGMIGDLPASVPTGDFLQKLKDVFQTGCIRHTKPLSESVKKIAICGGAGSFLIEDAIRAGADVFVTGDIKYHDFFRAEDKILIADIGHYESEQFTKELIFTILEQKFTNFAPQISKVNTNPVKYL